MNPYLAASLIGATGILLVVLLALIVKKATKEKASSKSSEEPVFRRSVMDKIVKSFVFVKATANRKNAASNYLKGTFQPCVGYTSPSGFAIVPDLRSRKTNDKPWKVAPSDYIKVGQGKDIDNFLDELNGYGTPTVSRSSASSAKVKTLMEVFDISEAKAKAIAALLAG